MIEFRKEALDEEFNPKKIEDELVLMSPPVYLLLAALLTVAIALFVWGFFGSVTDKTTMKGIIYPEYGMTGMSLPYNGTVRTLWVLPGEEVHAGQRLCLVEVDGRYSTISSTCSGKVVSAKDELSRFESFEPVVTVQKANADAVVNTITAFASFKSFRELSSDMEVQVNPTYLPIEKNGYIPGKITAIHTVPETRIEALKRMKMAQFAENVFPTGEVAYEVHIELELNPENGSDFNWTFEQEKPVDMSVGTICDIRVITKRRSVVRYLFESCREKARKAHEIIFE